jgi:cytochrome c oxidase subunit 2
MLRRVPLRAIASMLLLVAIGGLLASCGVGDAANDPQTTIDPAGEAGDIIQDIYALIWWLAVIVFILVEGLLVFAIFKFRKAPKTIHGRPAPVHGNAKLEVIWTVIPAVILVIIAIPTLQGISDLSEKNDDAFRINVYGNQFFWEFEYPEYDNLTVTEEFHFPAGQRIDLYLYSNDVIHSFWVPRLNGKTDAIPGNENHMWIQADETGTFIGQCAEFCGVSHALMTITAVADTPADFEAWVAEQQAAPDDPALAGQEVFGTKCTTCHKSAEYPDGGSVGPSLVGFAERPMIAGVLENTPDNLRAWLTNPPAEKPGTIMPNLGLPAEEIDWLIAYLETQTGE